VQLAVAAGSVIGVGVDVDAGTLWWRIDDGEVLTAYTGLKLTDGVFPAVSPFTTCGSKRCFELKMNLGRHPFKFPPPLVEGYLPVESWWVSTCTMTRVPRCDGVPR
jgi:hypothetical protein